MVVLQILARAQIPIRAAALFNPAVRARSVVELIEDITERPCPWNAESRKVADRLDRVARAGDIAARTPQPPLLVLSGEPDFPVLRTDAAELVEALHQRYTQPDHVQLTTVAHLAHPLESVHLVPGLPLSSGACSGLR